MTWSRNLPGTIGGSRVTLQDGEAPTDRSACSLTGDLSLWLSDCEVDSDLGRRWFAGTMAYIGAARRDVAFPLVIPRMGRQGGEPAHAERGVGGRRWKGHKARPEASVSAYVYIVRCFPGFLESGNTQLA